MVNFVVPLYQFTFPKLHVATRSTLPLPQRVVVGVKPVGFAGIGLIFIVTVALSATAVSHVAPLLSEQPTV